MINPIDLHVHTTYSDGTCTPEELFVLAKKGNILTLSITDHDTMAAYDESILLASQYEIEYIPGIELSTDFFGQEIHILGYYLDPSYPPLVKKLQTFIESRDIRNEKMLALLQEKGFTIQTSQLKAAFPNSIITRAHIANYLLTTKQIPTMKVAFQYIQDDGPCYVNRERYDSTDAIDLIHQAGGLAFIAHPTLYHLDTTSYHTLFSTLKAAGLDGIEAIYSTYSPDDTRKMKAYAKQYDLLISGGSDFHGENKPYIHLGTGRGPLFIPSSILIPIKAHRKK
jgi:3',5'-nucleoside bisphosphate phosphatase